MGGRVSAPNRDACENTAEVSETSRFFHWLLQTPLRPAATCDSGRSGLLASPKHSPAKSRGLTIKSLSANQALPPLLETKRQVPKSKGGHVTASTADAGNPVGLSALSDLDSAQMCKNQTLSQAGDFPQHTLRIWGQGHELPLLLILPPSANLTPGEVPPSEPHQRPPRRMGSKPPTVGQRASPLPKRKGPAHPHSPCPCAGAVCVNVEHPESVRGCPPPSPSPVILSSGH